MDEVWNAKRIKLQKELSLAVIALMEHTGSAATLVPLYPEAGVLLAVGTKDAIRGMLEDIEDVSGANDNDGN